MRGVLIAVLATMAACCSLSAAAAADGAFAIRDVRVFDGHRNRLHRTVLVRDGRIASVRVASAPAPSDAHVIDGRGRTLLPGLIDAHVHVSQAHPETALRQALWFGVTTEFDMFTGLPGLAAMKRERVEDPPDLADVRTAGIGATAPHGHPTELGGPPFPTLERPEEAQAFVDARLKEGSDWIKIIIDDCREYGPDIRPCPTLGPATVKALVAAAHKRGAMVVAHIGTEAAAREAIEAGVDGLAHDFVGDDASPGFGAFVASHHVWVSPTLSVLYWWCGRSSGPRIAADPKLAPGIARDFAGSLHIPPLAHRPSCVGTDEALRQMHAAHVTLLAGTDSPAPGTAYGASLLDELRLLVADGLTPTEALTAATATPAAVFHLNDRGVVRPGARADLLLVEGDPSRDITKIEDIVAVWKRGHQVERPGAP